MTIKLRILEYGATEYSFDAPQYGYKSVINMSLIHSSILPRGYVIWDNDDTSAHDFRTTSFNLKLNATQTTSLQGFFDEIAKARGASVRITLEENSGFFPFGPDRGDAGGFNMRLIKMTPQPIMEEPWMYFDTEFTFVEESNPSYTLPSEKSEGDFQIGTIKNLRYPPEFPQSSTDYGFSTSLTYDGTAYTVDKTDNSDADVSRFTMICNESKAAALIDHLSRVARADDLNVVSQGGNWIFGNKNGASGTYTCQMLNSKIEITHTRFDEFAVGLAFYRKSTL